MKPIERLKYYLHRAEKPTEEFFHSHAPLIIQGRGHSGTRIFSTLVELLGYNLSNAVVQRKTGDPADKIFKEKIKRTVLAYLKGRDRSTLLKEALYNYYLNLEGDKKLWGWKYPETYLIQPLLTEIFPNAKILHVVRDGRDIAFKSHVTDRIDKNLGKIVLQKANALKDERIIQSAKSWAFQVDLFDAYKHEIPSENFFEVRFEKMCETPLETGKEIAAFLGLELNEAAISFLKNGVNASKLAEHKLEKAEKIQKVEAKINITLSNYGYV